MKKLLGVIAALPGALAGLPAIAHPGHGLEQPHDALHALGGLGLLALLVTVAALLGRQYLRGRK